MGVVAEFDAFEFASTGSYAGIIADGGNFRMTDKETVRALLDRLPDDCTLEDVQYHLYVVQAMARGEADEEAGRTIPQEQVDAALRGKWLLGRAG